MPESTQHKLDRIRPPRVQITYDVEIGDAIVKKELPFVVGIMADLSGTKADGKPSKELKPLRERKYIEIDRDNFNDVLASVAPELTGVKAKINLQTDGSSFQLTDAFIAKIKTKGVSDDAVDRLKPKTGRNGNRPVIGRNNFINKVRKALGEKEFKKLDPADRETWDTAKDASPPAWLNSEPFNTLLADEFTVASLKFSHLDDFTPINVLKQVDVLRNLFEARQRLNDMLSKLDGNDALDKLFQELAADAAKFNEQKALVSPSGSGNQPSGGGNQPSGGGNQPSGGGNQPSGGGNQPSGNQ